MDSIKKFLSTTEAAKILGVSRVTVFQKIKKGEIKALKVGRNYVIPSDNLSPIFYGEINEEDKKEISRTVDKVVEQYGDALKKLGNE